MYNFRWTDLNRLFFYFNFLRNFNLKVYDVFLVCETFSIKSGKVWLVRMQLKKLTAFVEGIIYITNVTKHKFRFFPQTKVCLLIFM